MKAKIFAVLAAAVVAVPGGVAYAEPHAHNGHDSVRYAAIKSCGKDGDAKPCGDWRLVMHDGSQSTLHDAQTVALDVKGKKLAYASAPIAVSGNGQRIAYLTKTGKLAVRTLGGGVKLFAKDALPRVDQSNITLRLSDDGARLAAVISGEKVQSTRVFDTATAARLGSVPGNLIMLGFSGDGGEVLTSADADEGVTDLAVYSDTGEQLVRGTPPQVVSSNSPQALSADGRTVAAVVAGSKPQLVLYDMQSDQVVDRKKLTLPAGDIDMVDWTGDTQVTVHLVQYLESGNKMTIVQIDTETGAVKVRDRYRMLKGMFVFAACGG
ncbi:WD40 repeat domain-containing protein [Nonomuraea angiospora]|uniref:hypothetical protein n=1 Tax=Nonomuraea angiospora TaxID=46172 RepID=UPI0029A7A2AC|nr:hypothetical protein [Nonomuraea angiospora]MDX3106544.1 hypothetical protein [Nonomuraea angiospora]